MARSLMAAWAMPTFAFLEEMPSRAMTGRSSMTPVEMVGRAVMMVRMLA
jgi:hypothetical protein